MIIAKNIPCTLYTKLVYSLISISFCLLLLLFVPGFGQKYGGAIRWFRLWEGVTFQPSDFSKTSLAIYMAYFMSKHRSHMGKFAEEILALMLITGILVVPIVFQPDIWTAIIICYWLLILLFIGGAKCLHVFIILIIGTQFVWQIVFPAEIWPHRWLTFGSYGFFGTGFGNGKLRLFRLPELHTDFALSVVAEELGLLGVAVIVLLFGLVIMQGMKIAFNARDTYSKYLALGLICFSAFRRL